MIQSGETRGRDTERGEKIPVLAAEDPSAGSSNRGGPDRGRSRSARLKHKEKLARIVTKVQQEIQQTGHGWQIRSRSLTLLRYHTLLGTGAKEPGVR